METDRNVLQEEAGSLADRWATWARSNREPAARLANLMHDATLAGVDPNQAHAPLTVTINSEVLPATRKNVAEAIKRVRGQMRGHGVSLDLRVASPSPYRRASGSQAKLQMPRKSGAASKPAAMPRPMHGASISFRNSDRLHAVAAFQGSAKSQIAE